MSIDPKELLQQAKAGDINAFQNLFAEFQHQLRSYLFRLLASRSDAEDIIHDTFIQAFDKLHQFRSDASLKTWVFQIATHLAYGILKRRKRWSADVSEQAKSIVSEYPTLAYQIEQVSSHSPAGSYDIKEHIDTCFTCIGKKSSD